MINASLPLVSTAMWRTAVLMLAISPLPVLPLVTPQSIRMCFGPVFDGTVTRKKSPKPTRYIRIRRLLGLLSFASLLALLDFGVLGIFGLATVILHAR